MKEEDHILKKVGRDNPFGVPDGYFDHLTQTVMNQLPEKATTARTIQRVPTRWERFKPWLYMAAMFVGAALIIRVASTHDAAPPADVVAMENIPDAETVSDEYISTLVDNSMLDDYSLYIFLTDAGAEY
ncbi:MAG: hypothetical protein LBN06_09855 [Prevotellaceae bacterium]|jgi:hypothetical protein|nr:hypothetical protein [Prevotellaceae bacterium]